jgi:hypothetical protein
MSDIRQRLADALDQAWDTWMTAPHDDPDKRLESPLWTYVADVLLSLPGIAIVELPETQATNSVKTDFGRFVEYWHHPPRDRIERSITTYEAPTLMRAETARALAAALLAAANAAEADQ